MDLQTRVGWSDNKVVKCRRVRNYEHNLQQHDRNTIPYKYIVRQEMLQNPIARTPLKKIYSTEKESQKIDEEEEDDEKDEEKGQKQKIKFEGRWIPKIQIEMSRINPLMQLCGILVLIVAIICGVAIFWKYGGEDNTNVSQCFIKFKELGCSIIKPSQECKQYLECLQSFPKDELDDSFEGIGYYRGLVIGVLGYILKKYVFQRILN